MKKNNKYIDRQGRSEEQYKHSSIMLLAAYVGLLVLLVIIGIFS